MTTDWITGDAFVSTPDGRYGMQMRISAPADTFPTSRVMTAEEYELWLSLDQEGRTELEIGILFEDPVR